MAIRRLKFENLIDDAQEWQAAVTRILGEGRTSQHWITTEEVDELLARRPERGLIQRIRNAKCDNLFDPTELSSADFLELELEALVDEANEQFTSVELSDSAWV